MNLLISELFINRELLISSNKVYLSKIHQYFKFTKKNTHDPILDIIQKNQLKVNKIKLIDSNLLKSKLGSFDGKLIKKEILEEIERKNSNEKNQNKLSNELSDLLKIKTKNKNKSKDKNIEIKIKKLNKTKNIDKNFSSYENMAMQAEYNRLLESYQKFHNEYMNSQNNAYNEKQYSNVYSTEEKKEREFEWGSELINFKERKDLMKSIQMNALMGGAHNYVDPSVKELYKYWKISSAFNQQMSFLMYDTLIN